MTRPFYGALDEEVRERRQDLQRAEDKLLKKEDMLEDKLQEATDKEYAAQKKMDELLEKSLPHDEEARILKMITADPAVSSPHNLRTRRIGQNISIEAHIRVEGTMTVADSHRLTEEIERRLRNAYGEGTMVSIHVEPKR